MNSLGTQAARSHTADQADLLVDLRCDSNCSSSKGAAGMPKPEYTQAGATSTDATVAPQQHSSPTKLRYAAVYSAVEGEGYDAYLPGGPCVIGAGLDIASTKQNLEAGLQLWIEDAMKHGSKIPKSDSSLEPYQTVNDPEVVRVDWVEVDMPRLS